MLSGLQVVIACLQLSQLLHQRLGLIPARTVNTADRQSPCRVSYTAQLCTVRSNYRDTLVLFQSPTI